MAQARLDTQKIYPEWRWYSETLIGSCVLLIGACVDEDGDTEDAMAIWTGKSVKIFTEEECRTL